MYREKCVITRNDIYLPGEGRRILLRTNAFICLLPHASLQTYISSYNITFPSKDIMPDSFTEMPCGCATLSIEQGSGSMEVVLTGPTTKPCVIGSQANQLEMLITLEFKPAGLYALTGIDQSELTNDTVFFDSVNPSLSRLISEAVESAESVVELATSLDLLLLQNMYTVCHPQFMEAFEHIAGCAGNIDVHSLAGGIHYSERQMNRIFKQHAGVSTKTLSRIIRIHNAIRLLKKPANRIELVSDVMGFHDISHFTRDFRLLCGVGPQVFRDNMSDFYINTQRF